VKSDTNISSSEDCSFSTCSSIWCTAYSMNALVILHHKMIWNRLCTIIIGELSTQMRRFRWCSGHEMEQMFCRRC
jgi:hypothetical protein